MNELEESIDRKITALCEEGERLSQQQRYPEALRLYWEAFGQLPTPPEQWEAATWILVAVADANFLGNDFEAGRDNLTAALRCPGALGNSFVHLRLGQCQYELGNLDRAADELARAYMGAGVDIFKLDDPKYLNFLKTRLEPPVHGSW